MFGTASSTTILNSFDMGFDDTAGVFVKSVAVRLVDNRNNHMSGSNNASLGHRAQYCGVGVDKRTALPSLIGMGASSNNNKVLVERGRVPTDGRRSKTGTLSVGLRQPRGEDSQITGSIATDITVEASLRINNDSIWSVLEKYLSSISQRRTNQHMSLVTLACTTSFHIGTHDLH